MREIQIGQSRRRDSSRQRAAVLVLVVALAMFQSACNESTSRKLAVASDTIATGLLDAQNALAIGVQQNQISAADAAAINAQFVRVSQAGLVLNEAIRSSATATDLRSKVDLFLAAFDGLVQNGVVGIKNNELRFAISTAVNGARAGLAIITATMSGGN